MIILDHLFKKKMKNLQKTYTIDGLIVVPRNIFISLEESIKDPSLLDIPIYKINGLEDIQGKDEELWNYFTHNQRYFTENYEEGSRMAVAFVTAGLFTYSLLEMANEPEPLLRMSKETICTFNRRVKLYPNPTDYVRNTIDIIKSENPILWEAIDLISKNCFFTKTEATAYLSGAHSTYELIRLSAQKH